MQKGKKSLFTTQSLTRVAILISMSFLLKSFFVLTLPTYRFTFYEIPLMITGIMFGPIIGGFGGLIVDWFNILVPNYATGFNLFTISSMMWGIIPGLLLFGRKELSMMRIVNAVLITSLVCFSINTFQLYLFMGSGVLANLPVRAVTLIIKLPLQVLILDILFKRVLVWNLKLAK